MLKDVQQHSANDAKKVKKHMLTPISNTFVTCHMSQSMTSRMTQKPACCSAGNYKPVRNSSTHARSSDREVDSANDIKHNVCNPEKTQHCWHYRIVFKEYAMLLEQVKKMGDVFTILADLI